MCTLSVCRGGGEGFLGHPPAILARHGLLRARAAKQLAYSWLAFARPCRPVAALQQGMRARCSALPSSPLLLLASCPSSHALTPQGTAHAPRRFSTKTLPRPAAALMPCVKDNCHALPRGIVPLPTPAQPAPPAPPVCCRGPLQGPAAAASTHAPGDGARLLRAVQV